MERNEILFWALLILAVLWFLKKDWRKQLAESIYNFWHRVNIVNNKYSKLVQNEVKWFRRQLWLSLKLAYWPSKHFFNFLVTWTDNGFNQAIDNFKKSNKRLSASQYFLEGVGFWETTVYTYRQFKGNILKLSFATFYASSIPFSAFLISFILYWISFLD